MNHRNPQTLADATQSAHAPRATKKTARSLMAFAMTGLILCAGVSLGGCSTFPSAATSATAPVQNTKELAPGLTVVFPAPPKPFAMPMFGEEGFWSAISSVDGHPVKLIAGSVSFPEREKSAQKFRQIFRASPDFFAKMAPFADGFISGINPKKQEKNQVSITEAKRSRATAGFPGIYYAWQNSPFPANALALSSAPDESDSSDSPDAQTSPDAPKPVALQQVHGYVLFVNGNVVMFALAQPAGTPPDSQALARFMAAAHFPPAEKAGTLDEQIKGAGLAIGKLLSSNDNDDDKADTSDSSDEKADTSDSSDEKADSGQDDSNDQSDSGDQDDSSDQSDPE